MARTETVATSLIRLKSDDTCLSVTWSSGAGVSTCPHHHGLRRAQGQPINSHYVLAPVVLIVPRHSTARLHPSPRWCPSAYFPHWRSSSFRRHLSWLSTSPRNYPVYLAQSIDPNTSYSLPRNAIPLKEVAVASTASILGGFGVVALFCTAGVYV